LAFPPQAEQERIANFLDEQTARIDALIAEKERLVSRFNEFRDATCRNALNRGLSPSADLLESGEQFLGKMPAQWRVLPWKRLGRFTGGAGFPIEYQGVSTEEIPFFKVKDLDADDLLQPLTETDNTVSRETAEKLRATVFHPGTLTFAKVGAALLLLRVRRLGVQACLDNNMMAFIPNTEVVDPTFAQLALGILPLDWLVNPGAVPSVSASQVGDVKVALPNLEEQRSIASYVLSKFAEYSSVSSHLVEHVLRLREYRSSLILAAVTGQLNIDDFKARQLEAA
jgi:type I restriction enzyme S subunit